LAKSKEKPAVERAKIFNGHNQLGLEDPDGALRYPNLFDVLRPLWKNGVQTRQRGRLVVAPLGSMYRVTVDCPTEVLECTIMLTSLVSMMEKIEAALASGEIVWLPGFKKNRKALPTVDDLIK